jgi:5-(carboxyamino)imidazole ribonucleotide synthase
VTGVPHPSTGMPVIGVVGGGQLARMTYQAAIALGVHVRVLAGAPDESAALVCADVVVGDHRSYDDVAALAAGCDVVTFDHEHVPLPVVDKLVAAGVAVRPGPGALPYVQDKLRMRERLGGLGLPVPAWREVADPGDVAGFAAEHGWPVVVKTSVGGYDGKGVWVVDTPAAADELVGSLRRAGPAAYVEEHVGFDRELAALVARSASGETVAWPVVESVQRDGICREVLAPAPGLDPALAAEARSLALRVATELDVVGVLAVELFEMGRRLLVNELAMRPHNSGHWTMDGATTSQFEQHVRAVLGWPLGATDPVAPYTVMVNVLGGEGPAAADLAARVPLAQAADPAVHVHLYGKGVRPGRKIGHVNVTGDDVAALLERGRRAAGVLAGDRS